MDRQSACGPAHGRTIGLAIVTAALGLGLMSAAARADDLPLPAPFSGLGSLPVPFSWILPNYKVLSAPYQWSGFFASPLINYQTAQFRGGGGRTLKDARGFTFGAEAGYNYQVGNVVVGPAADLSYSLMKGSANADLASLARAEIGWTGSARVRAGYTFDRFMLYATGGVAFAQAKVDGPLTSSTHVQPGWTAGGGFQYLWSESAIFQAEYRRVELQDKAFYALPYGQAKVGVVMNLINAGFYFKF
jgi:outer membrane immunogenic protein